MCARVCRERLSDSADAMPPQRASSKGRGAAHRPPARAAAVPEIEPSRDPPVHKVCADNTSNDVRASQRPRRPAAGSDGIRPPRRRRLRRRYATRRTADAQQSFPTRPRGRMHAVDRAPSLAPAPRASTPPARRVSPSPAAAAARNAAQARPVQRWRRRAAGSRRGARAGATAPPPAEASAAARQAAPATRTPAQAPRDMCPRRPQPLPAQREAVAAPGRADELCTGPEHGLPTHFSSRLLADARPGTPLVRSDRPRLPRCPLDVLAA